MPYMNVTEVESAIAALASTYPATCERIALPHASIEGRAIHALRLGLGPADSRPAALFIGGQHAREWGSCEILVNFATDLLDAYDSGTGLAYGGQTYTHTEVRRLIEGQQVFLLPCVNPDGRHHSQTVESMWRKNRNPAEAGNGVDLNRNYDFLWDFPTHFDPAASIVVSEDSTSDVYHGSAPHSEPEVKNVVWLLDTYPQVRWFIDVHSYSELLYYNWGDDENQTTDPTRNFLNTAYDGDRGLPGDPYREYIPSSDLGAAVCLADAMQGALSAVRGKTYTTGQSYALYPTSGTATDYPYSRHFADPSKSKTLGFLIEWGTEFQPPWSEMEEIVRDVSSALIAFALRAPDAEPSVTLSTPSLLFPDVPEGETHFRSVTFAVQACDAVTLSIVSGPSVSAGPPGSSFGTPAGTTTTVPAGTTQDAHLWVSFTGTNAGDVAVGEVTVRWEEVGMEWTVPILTQTIAPPTTALTLVLDKSGSMNQASGFGVPLESRIDVLRMAAGHLVDVIAERHGIGIASFDQDATVDMPVLAVGPDLYGPGRIAATTTVSGHSSTGGATSIGDGVEAGRSLLDAISGFDHEAMIVFTDGHENRSKYIADVAASIDQRVFAVGLGTAQEIRPSALASLTEGTGGYLLLTGDLQDDLFLLSKYFLQVLAGATNADVVLDPSGRVAAGQTHRIPFHVSDADLHGDAILLTPIPQLLDFVLETPAGKVLSPPVAAASAGASFVPGKNLVLYRVALPTLVDGAAAGAGTWHARIRLDEKRAAAYFRKWRAGRDDVDPDGGAAGTLESWATLGLPYSFNVHAYSNLRLRASCTQSGFVPGAELVVRARITEGGAPLLGQASVRCEVRRPDGSQATVAMHEVERGVFELRTEGSPAGVHRFRVLAEGETVRGVRFTREALATAGVHHGGDAPWPTGDEPVPGGDGRPVPGGPGGDSGGDTSCCDLLCCLLDPRALTPELEKRLRAIGFDVAALRRCLEEACRWRESGKPR